MKIAHRLYLTVVPAIVGVLVVAGLAYWGQYARTVPHLLLVIAAVAAIGSAGMSWVNARYVAQRIERLAGPGAAERTTPGLREVASVLLPTQLRTRPDELDTIEGVVDRLSTAVADAEQGRTKREEAFAARTREYASLLGSVSEAAAKRVEEMRLPLHILLENHFGDLNENQEEMLGAARTAAEATDADLVALRQIAELDLGTRTLRHDRFLPGDLIAAIVPMLKATAEHQTRTLRIDIEPLVPAMRGDRPLLQESLTTLLGDAIRLSESGADLSLTLVSAPDGVRIALSGAQRREATVKSVLARRVIALSGGSTTWEGGALAITFRGAGAPAST